MNIVFIEDLMLSTNIDFKEQKTNGEEDKQELKKIAYYKLLGMDVPPNQHYPFRISETKPTKHSQLFHFQMITLDRDQKEQRIHGKSQGSYFTELLFYLLNKKLEKALPVDCLKKSYNICTCSPCSSASYVSPV